MDLDLQYDKIYRYCYYKVRDKQTAEDITQETFLRFLDSGYSEQGKKLQYLYTIARHLCIDHFRRQGQAAVLFENESESAADASRFSGFEDVVTVRADVQKAISMLSEEDREILLLKYANEEKDHVICKVYGMSRFALYRRLRRLKRTLRALLSDDYL